MRIITIISLFVFGVFLSGCSRPGSFPRNVSVDEIVRNVKCELLQAVQENLPYSPWLKDWTSQVDLFLEVERGWGPSGEVDIVTPIHNGVFSLGLRSGISRTATNSITIKFLVTDLTDFKSYGCPIHEPDGKRGRLLAGETGLKQWLSHAVDGMERNDVFADSPGITYKLNFLLTASGSITPGIDVTNPTGTRVRASLGLGGAKAKTHTLTIAMTKKSGDGAQVKLLTRIAAALEKERQAAVAKANALDVKAAKAKKAAEDAKKAAAIERKNLNTLQATQKRSNFFQLDDEQKRKLTSDIAKTKSDLQNKTNDERDAQAQANAAANRAAAAKLSARTAAMEAAAAATQAAAVRRQLFSATRQQLDNQILQEIFRDRGRR